MRTDVKVGLICAFAIVLCVIIYFVAKGRPQPVAAHADTPNSRVSSGSSDLRPASPGTPSNPVVTSDPILPDHTLAGSSTGTPVGGGVIRMPGDTPPTPPTPTTPAGTAGAPTTPGATSPSSPLATAGTPTTPTTPGMGSGGTPTIGSTPTMGSIPTIPTSGITPTTPTRPTLVLGSGAGTPMATTGGTTYKIQKGDMLGAIAKKNGVSLHALEIANPGVDSNHLKIGDSIKIPAATPTATGTPTTPTTPTRTGTPTTPAMPTIAGTSTPAHPGMASHPVSTPTTTTIKPGTTYVIKKGDTLATISRAAYGSTAGTQKIFRANRSELNDPDVMPIGASIKIP